MAVNSIRRWVTGEPVSRFLGNVSDAEYNPGGYVDGPSSVAEFSLISDFVQFNSTKMAIGDYTNACVRLYDFETDMVSTIVGVCNAFARRIIPYNGTWNHMDNKVHIKDSLAPQFGGVIGITVLEKWNKLLVLDSAYKVIIQHNFAEQKTQVLDTNFYENYPGSVLVKADEDENNIFISHAYGLSKYNFHTQQITLLFGTFDGTTSKQVELIPGPFTTARTGQMRALSWLLQDKILVALRKAYNEALILIDLKSKQGICICEGKMGNPVVNWAALYMHI